MSRKLLIDVRANKHTCGQCHGLWNGTCTIFVDADGFNEPLDAPKLSLDKDARYLRNAKCLAAEVKP